MLKKKSRALLISRSNGLVGEGQPKMQAGTRWPDFRRSILASILPVGLLLVPLSIAQNVASAESRVEDPAGDERIRVIGENTTRVGDAYSHVDLREVWISNETLDSFEVGLRLQEWEDPLANQPENLFWRQLRIHFRFANATYVVADHAPFSSMPGCGPNQALLWTNDGRQGWNSELYSDDLVACLSSTVDPASASWRVTVPKEHIKSARQVPVQEGNTLQALAANAWQSTINGLNVGDRAPDNGWGPRFLLQEGPGERHGDIFLVPEVPVRASNGESTTMVFPVKLVNRGLSDDVVAIAAETPMPDWTVRAPARLRAPAGQTVVFPVILSVAFSHQHGATEFFELKAESMTRADHYATVPLGVHWLDVPQPAGHHDRLWFHSAMTDYDAVYATLPGSVMGSREGWVNAAEADPRKDASDEDLPGRGYGQALDTTVWLLPLAPSLQVGLDLDHDRMGVLETTVRSSFPSTTASLEARLEYCEAEDSFFALGFCVGQEPSELLLEGETPTTSLPTNGETPFRVELTPNPEIDTVPYAPGSVLRLVVALRHDLPQALPAHYQPPTPRLAVRGSTLVVPLTEYHDPIDQAFEGIASVSLSAVDPAEKPVNPGRTVAFRFDVTNNDEREQRFLASAEGVNSEWAGIAGDSEFSVGPGGRRQATLLVRAPADAQPGERAELFFVVESRDDPAVVALSRIRAVVVDPLLVEVTDEARILDEKTGGDSPALSGALAVAAAAIALLGRRLAGRQ